MKVRGRSLEGKEEEKEILCIKVFKKIKDGQKVMI